MGAEQCHSCEQQQQHGWGSGGSTVAPVSVAHQAVVPAQALQLRLLNKNTIDSAVATPIMVANST